MNQTMRMKRTDQARGLVIGVLVFAMMLLWAGAGSAVHAAPNPEPVQIETYAQLQAFIDGVNDGTVDPAQDAVLTADIAVPAEVGNGWVPLAKDMDHAYQGTFDGDGHTVSGISINRTYPNPWTEGTKVENYTAFLSFLGAQGTVKNLVVEADITDVNDAAGIVSQNLGTISYCCFGGSLSSSIYPNEGGGASPFYPNGTFTDSTSEAGGIAAANGGTITHCFTKHGTEIFRGGICCGGIAGLQYPGGRVEDCVNNASITSDNTSYETDGKYEGGIGGIAGGQGDSEHEFTAETKPVIARCENHGPVSSYQLFGGICGESYAGDIIDCTNTGEMKSGGGDWAGGIAGYFTTQETLTGDAISTMSGCTNLGDINWSDSPAGTYIGGIAGEVEDAAGMEGYEAPARVCDCDNYGSVCGRYGVGGVIGFLSNKTYQEGSLSHMTNVYELANLGEVKGYNAVGGVAGACPGVMASVINYGTVRGLPGYQEDDPVCCVGGLAGDCGVSGNISCGYNLGCVTAKGVTKYDVYLGGVMGSGNGNLPGCYYCMDTSGSALSAAGTRPEEIAGTLGLSDMSGDAALASMPELFDGVTGFHPQTAWTTLDPVTKDGTTYAMTPQFTSLTVYLDDILSAGVDTGYNLRKSLHTATVTVDGSSVYAGSPVVPAGKVTVTLKGQQLVQGRDYEIFNCYNNISAGPGIIVIEGKGTYSDAAQGTFTILPAKAGIKSVTAGKKKLTVKMKGSPSSCGATSYQISYRVKGASKWKTVTCTSASKTIKGLKKGKKYQVKVRATSTVDGKKYTGSWSAVKTSKKIK